MKISRWIAWSVAGAASVAAVAWVTWPRALPVEVAPVTRGPLVVTVEGPGRVRVRDRFVVAAPVSGHLGRVALRAGDEVATGQVVATVFPATPSPLDDRVRGELRARLEATRAAEAEALAAQERARHVAGQAVRERDRVRALAAGGSATARDLDASEAAAEESAHALDMAGAALLRARRETQATAALLESRAGPGERGTPVRSPAAGRVLRVLQESEGPVAAGAPILEVGNPERVELRIDLLTSEAVRVRPGARVELVNWGGDRALAGAVRVVEPSAFTKVSALGVEEQRVYVLADPTPPGAWAPLSDGFAADGRVVVADKEDALRVPAGALFRQDGSWAVFVLQEGHASLRKVRVGDAGGGAFEVLDGLSPGERVLVHPGDKVRDGVRVRAVAG